MSKCCRDAAEKTRQTARKSQVHVIWMINLPRAKKKKANLNLSSISCQLTSSVLSAGVRTWRITQIPNNFMFFLWSSHAAKPGARARGEEGCVSQSRCLACLMPRSYVIFRISSVLSARLLGDEGWWWWRGLLAMLGNTCQRLTGSFISTSLSLTRVRPSLYVRRAVKPQFAAQQLLCAPPPPPPPPPPSCYVTCHPYHKDPSQTRGLTTHTHTYPQRHGWNEIWLLWTRAGKGAIEYVGEWGPWRW